MAKSLTYTRTLALGGHEFYNFGRIYPGHYYYILSLPDLWPGIGKKIFKEITHCHNMTYMDAPLAQEPLSNGL